MYRNISHLLLFSDLREDEILVQLGRIFRDWESGSCDRDELIGRIYGQMKRLLDLATACGFDDMKFFYSVFKKHMGVLPGYYREQTSKK